jgi:hypothetical protein
MNAEPISNLLSRIAMDDMGYPDPIFNAGEGPERAYKLQDSIAENVIFDEQNVKFRITAYKVVVSKEYDCIRIKKESDMVQHHIAVDEFGDLKAYDENGQGVQLSTLWQTGSAVLVFVRHFG